MRKKSFDEQGNAGGNDRETLKAALRTMSLDQLHELRSTIVRLKHLPFTKLTEVLFTESPPSEGDHTGSARIREDSHAFTYEFRGHCEAEATRTLNDTILRALKLVEFPRRATDSGVRVTVLLFPIDEISDMDDIAATVEALGSGVDWVLVRNKVKTPRTRMFDGSELERELKGYGAVWLDLPALLSDTRNHLRAVELQEGRGVSPAEALRNPDLPMDTTHRIILEDWLRTLFQEFDAIAGHLLPTTEAGAILARLQPSAEKRNSRRGAKVNRANIE